VRCGAVVVGPVTAEQLAPGPGDGLVAVHGDLCGHGGTVTLLRPEEDRPARPAAGGHEAGDVLTGASLVRVGRDDDGGAPRGEDELGERLDGRALGTVRLPGALPLVEVVDEHEAPRHVGCPVGGAAGG